MSDISSNPIENPAHLMDNSKELVELIPTILREIPVDFDLLFEKIAELICLEKYEISIEILLKIQKLHPTSSLAASFLGYIYCLNSNYSDACGSLQRAIALNSTDVIAFFNLANLAKITTTEIDFSNFQASFERMKLDYLIPNQFVESEKVHFLSPFLMLEEQKKAKQTLMELFPTTSELTSFIAHISQAQIENKTRL